jgi:hypothetical protein
MAVGLMRATRVLTATLAAALCITGGIAASAQTPPPPLVAEVIPPGPLPGKQVHGSFRGAGLRQPPDVRELAVTGGGWRRTTLLIARGVQDQLCYAVKVGARVRKASFTCLASWDHAPMLLRVGIGGSARDLTEWFALVGLVRQDVGKVAFDSQRSFTIFRKLRLRSWAGFPWKAFAVTTRRRGDLPTTVLARDESGLPVQEIDLGWVYGSPCEDRHSPTRVVGVKTPAKCKGRRRLRAWSDERDPLGARQAPWIRRGAGARAKRIAFDHPTVRTLVAGQAFSFDAVALWSKCNGGSIGAILEIRLTKPVTFEGDVPVKGHRASSRTAYVEGVMHVKAQGLLSIWVAVDLNRRAVVGIDFYSADFGSATELPKPTIERKIVQDWKPAGGPDSGCREYRD